MDLGCRQPACIRGLNCVVTFCAQAAHTQNCGCLYVNVLVLMRIYNDPTNALRVALMEQRGATACADTRSPHNDAVHAWNKYKVTRSSVKVISLLKTCSELNFAT
eukprot:3544187-Pleurochrysis_carterae.AAC.2